MQIFSKASASHQPSWNMFGVKEPDNKILNWYNENKDCSQYKGISHLWQQREGNQLHFLLFSVTSAYGADEILFGFTVIPASNPSHVLSIFNKESKPKLKDFIKGPALLSKQSFLFHSFVATFRLFKHRLSIIEVYENTYTNTFRHAPATLASLTGTNPYIQSKHPFRKQIATLRQQEDNHKLTRNNSILPIYHIDAELSHFVHIPLVFCINQSKSCTSMLNICLSVLAFCFLVGNNQINHVQIVFLYF